MKQTMENEEALDLARRENDALINRLRKTPLDWPELKSIILSPNVDDLSKLARSEEQTRTYRKCRADIKNEWQSIYDYLLCTKFGFDWVWIDSSEAVDSNGDANCNKNIQRKKRSKPTHEEYLCMQQQNRKEGRHQTIQLKLCINDFPYYFANGVDHWVLWKLGGVVSSDEITKAKEDIFTQSSPIGINGNDNLKRIVSDDEVFLHWINPPHLKSLPGIDHVHILFYRVGTSHL